MSSIAAAPAIGFVTQGIAIYLMIANRIQLAGNVGYVRIIPELVFAIFAVGLLVAAVYRAKARQRYAAIGRFVHEEA